MDEACRREAGGEALTCHCENSRKPTATAMNPHAIIIFWLLLALPPQILSPSPCRAEETPGRTLTIPGTGDSQSLLRNLAGHFMRFHPGITVEIPDSTGSGGGIHAVLHKEYELARVARPLRGKETAFPLKHRPFALSPVVFVTHPSVGAVKSLSPEQVVAIYSGRLKDWRDLGGSGKIYVMNREEGDSSRSILESAIPGFRDIPEFAGEKIYSTPDAVHTLLTYANTIGYLPLPMAKGQPLHVLRFDGIAPDEANIRNKKYPLVITFAMVWQEPLSGLARDFLQFLHGPAAKKIIIENGAIPVE
ncbi:PstS family phosphate ABC transporter substrate-binding protein [Thiovibrio sp. JS02]